MISYVVKSDGSKEEFNADKLNRWAEFASVIGVSWSHIALNAYKKCHDGCTTLDLHKAMIDACVEEEDEKHLKMAGRLLIGVIYKEAYGGYSKIPTLQNFYDDMTRLGLWANMDYSVDEINYLNSVIQNNKDINYNYTTLRQLKDKYLINNKQTMRTLESPQFLFMGMAMQNMEHMPKDERLINVVELYTLLSDLKINAPSPFLSNMRTPLKGYASCNVSLSGDTIEGLAVNDHIAYKMTAMSAGIGVNINSRSKGDPVREGTVMHQGKLPYYRMIQSAVSANKQSSRGGSATVSFPCLDPEVEDILVLKNPTTVQQKRIRDIDYSMLVNQYFIEKVAKNEDWMLVSTYYAKELYDYFYSDDYDSFVSEYNRVLSDVSIPKTLVRARDVAIKALTEGVETGRIYITYIDTMNHQTPFLDKIYSSNLCQEIALPTKEFLGMKDLYSDDPHGEIGLCSLASIVLGRVSDEEYEHVAFYTVLMIDNVIDLMDYPFDSLRKTAQARRSLGIGLTNLAYDLAKRGLSYSSIDGKQHMLYVASRHSYYLYKASLKLSKIRGVAEWMHKTKYPQGWLPHHDAKNGACETIFGGLVTSKFDWAELSQQIKENGGIRNSTLIAFMPVESSSQLTNTTNSLYPVRNLKVMKTSNTNKNLLIVPEYDDLKDKYDIAWLLDSKDLIEMYAIFQMFTDQAISADLYLNLKDESKVSTSKLLKDFIYMNKLGCKTRYYLNSASGIIHSMFEEPKIEEATDDCSACKL